MSVSDKRSVTKYGGYEKGGASARRRSHTPLLAEFLRFYSVFFAAQALETQKHRETSSGCVAQSSHAPYFAEFLQFYSVYFAPQSLEKYGFATRLSCSFFQIIVFVFQTC